MHSGTDDTILERAGRLCRAVAATLIAGLRRGETFEATQAKIANLPLMRQCAVVGGVLAVLLALSIGAAQFGWLGMAVFWMIVILIVR